MPKVWRYLPHDEARVRHLSGRLRVTPLMAQVLVARGLGTEEAAADFLNAKMTELHDPELLPGLPAAADRVLAAVRDDRRITIYGDYDVDGMTATSLLWQCLKLAGARVDYFLPSRLTDGYGLNCDTLRQLHDEDPHRLVLSVDCGISSVDEAELAQELGLELIVTDHHEPGEQLPRAACLVHPRLPGGEYPFGDLCGAGVAFKLAWGICQRLGDGKKKVSPRMREFLKGAVGLAAIGTIGDVVPLLGENRILVRFGLGQLTEQSAPGLKALLEVSGLERNRVLDAEDVAFSLAPRLNAAGRLGQARLAVELLTTDNPERAIALAQYLDQLNKNRQTVERRIFKQAKELVAKHPHWHDDPALVVAHSDWHPGVIGIVANRMAEQFEKPAVLISLDANGGLCQGSGRTFADCDLHAALTACRDQLASYGGHQAAAGLKVEAGRIDSFREEFCRNVHQHRTQEPSQSELQIDAEVRLADVTRQAILELNRLGPFGQKNPRPLFAAQRVELAEPPRRMGEGERHLSLKVRQFGGAPLRAVAFGRGDWAERIVEAGGPICISFAAGINRFRGRENVELQLKDWQVDGAADGCASSQDETSSG